MFSLAELRRLAEKGVLSTPEETLALLDVVEALKPIAVGLTLGDSLATAWSEWPEGRDLERVAAALGRFDFGGVS